MVELNKSENHEEASTSFKVVLLIFAIVLVGVLGYMVWLSNTNSTETESTVKTKKTTSTTTTTKTTTDPTADWKTYTSTVVGFTVKYPVDYVVKEVKQNVTSIGKKDELGVPTFAIDLNGEVSADYTMSLDGVIQSLVKSSSISGQRRITLDNQVAYEGVSTGLVNSYWILAKKDAYLVGLLFNSGNKDTLSANKDMLTNTQKLILSTFKFTK